ncbi:hypothetical protein PCANC_12204 [Puccinia coronata f. sp. avenae]|uniref:Uncharacterized protein n=1 Tax=Puccinia coronata f. sp. avenae TaxID=200324 RepID=A0A2N5VEX0_9BASI|nr:hypothetical protein PCANC_12204 [Puccinia coronata f. sp. avenae]
MYESDGLDIRWKQPSARRVSRSLAGPWVRTTFTTSVGTGRHTRLTIAGGTDPPKTVYRTLPRNPSGNNEYKLDGWKKVSWTTKSSIEFGKNATQILVQCKSISSGLAKRGPRPQCGESEPKRASSGLAT